MATFSDVVREQSDDALVDLLRARPDLASPSPSTLRSLAARASSRTSLERALAQLDTPTVQVLEAVLALDGVVPGLTADDVAAAVSATTPDDVDAVRRLLRAAETRLLVWEDDGVLRPAPGLAEVLGPYPAGLGPARATPPTPVAGVVGSVVGDRVGGSHAPTRSPAAEPIEPLLDRLPPGAREVLDALAWGPPVGVVPPAGTPARDAVDALVGGGLLEPVDERTVVLPREVGLALRGGRTHHDPALTPPRPAHGRPVPPHAADADAAGAALEAVRLVDALLQLWDEAPPPVLRSGGLGVRDLHRVSRTLGVDDPTAASVVELAGAAGLVADDGDAPPSYATTTRADAWEGADVADRWGMLAAAWAGSRRTPWLAGTRDDKGTVRAPLSTELSRTWVPRLRAQVLAALVAMPQVAASLTDVMADLEWRSPRAVPPEPAVAGLLREAALLGATGARTLASTGRAVLDLLADTADADDAEAALAGVLRSILPAEVDEVLLQGDLTGIVPGRPSRALAALLEGAADVESRGAATTVRFTAPSVTRALDQGATAEQLLAELARRSPVPVPQPLEYLVRDTARRHESLRVGAAGSYVRAADPAVLAGLVEDPRLAALGLVRLAPTVVAAAVPAAELHAALRSRGMLAALEGPDGRPLGRLRRPPRVERGGARGIRSPYAPAGAPTSDAGRRALVERLRVADGGGRRGPFPSTAAGAPPSVETIAKVASSDVARHGGTAAPGDALAILRDAVRDGDHVWLELVDGHGRPVRRRVRPLRVEAGRVRALDTTRGAELTVAIHRIARVDPDDENTTAAGV